MVLSFDTMLRNSFVCAQKLANVER